MKSEWIVEGNLWTSGAYAQQLNLISQYLHDFGHDSTVANVPSFEEYGEALLAVTAKTDPDVLIAFGDAHPWPMAEYVGIPMLSWFLWGDKRPLPFTEGFPLVTFGCPSMRAVERLRNEIGEPARYLPHAFDPKVFYPGRRGAARTRLGWNHGAPVVLMVSTNLANNDHEPGPDRKNWRGALDAFNLLLETEPDALLYCHASSTGALNIPAYAEELGISKSVILADQTKMTTGNREFSSGYIGDLYRASNVLLMPSLAEGFGIPLIEAQACGIPVVTTADGGPMEELAITGRAVEGKPDERRPEWTVPNTDELAWALRVYIDYADSNTALQMRPFSVEAVVEDHFLPLLTELAEQKPTERPEVVYNFVPPPDTPLKLDIGSGGIQFERMDDTWTTVDAYAPAMIQAFMDSLPYEAESVDAIHSSHALEHIPRSKVIETLEEWFRVLRWGGTLSLLVPDMDYIADLWKEKGMYALECVFGSQVHPGEFHQTGWNLDGLKADLEDVGFTIDEAESIYTPEYTQNSLRIEAHK